MEKSERIQLYDDVADYQTGFVSGCYILTNVLKMMQLMSEVDATKLEFDENPTQKEHATHLSNLQILKASEKKNIMAVLNQ